MQCFDRIEIEKIPKNHAPDHLVRNEQRRSRSEGRYLLQCRSGPAIGIGVAFATWETPLIEVGESLGKFTGKGSFDLLVRETDISPWSSLEGCR